MTPLEFDLLKAFAEHPNQAFSRDRILALSQQRDLDPFNRSVDIRIMRLRKKVEPDPEHPQFIKTVRNEGYVFVPGGT
jgi:two-component system phosphate regulon response regulator OmpR